MVHLNDQSRDDSGRWGNIMAVNAFDATSTTKMAANILESYVRADAQCIADGRAWYGDAHNLVTDLARAYDLDMAVVAAATAALSPRQAWAFNVRNVAATLVEDGLDRAVAVAILNRHGYRVESYDQLDAPRGLSRSTDKARAIVQTGDPSLLTGQKVRSFADNIADPAQSDAVTIDAWAAGVAMGRRLNNAEMA